MNIGGLLTGLVLLLAGLNWAGVATINWVVIGWMAVIAGIIWILNAVGVATTVPLHHNTNV